MKMFMNENNVTSIDYEEVYALISPYREIIILNESIEYIKKYAMLTHSKIEKGYYRVSKGSTKNCKYTHKEWVNV